MSGRLPEPMPMAELLTQPPVIDLMTAARALRLQRGEAYKLAAEGHFPCEVDRRDHRYTVKLADLLRCLGFDPAMVAVFLASSGTGAAA